MKTSNKQILQLLLTSVLALSSMAPVVVAGCYETATGIANYGVDGGTDCTPTETTTDNGDGTFTIVLDCSGTGCYDLAWANYYCDGPTDTSPLSCGYCNEEYGDVDGYIETGPCVSVVEWPDPINDPTNYNHYCTCQIDPNSGTVCITSGVITNTGSDCEMCPERVGS